MIFDNLLSKNKPQPYFVLEIIIIWHHDCQSILNFLNDKFELQGEIYDMQLQISINNIQGYT